MKPPQDFPLSQLRMVKLRFKEDRTHSQDALMHESQVEAYVKAKLELHWEPGVNPHWLKHRIANGMPEAEARAMSRTAVMWEITVARFDANGLGAVVAQSYWHTSPGLHAGDEGAYVIPDYHTQRLWAHPDLLADDKAAEELEAEFD